MQTHRGFELYFASTGDRLLKCGVSDASNPMLCNINRAVTFAREAVGAAFRCGESVNPPEQLPKQMEERSLASLKFNSAP